VVFPLVCVSTGVHQRGARGHQVARKDQVRRRRACSKNNISMINVFALTIIESKLSKLFIRSVYQTSSPSH